MHEPTPIDNLPVAVYLVTPEGDFLYGNQRLCSLLDIGHDELLQTNIGHFYSQPAERAELVAAVRAGELIENRTLDFIVSDGREIRVQMYCRPITTRTNELSGFLGVLLEITGETEYHGLFEAHLPAGVYRLDRHDTFTYANQRFLKIHGYQSLDEIRGHNVADFYADRRDAELVRDRIKKQELLRHEQVLLLRKDGTTFEAYLTAIPFFTRNGAYDGRGGIVEDRTREKEYQQIFEDIPVGFYVVRNNAAGDILIDCNREFARIHDVASVEDVLNQDVRRFHESEEETKRLTLKLQAAARSGTAVLGEQLRIRTATGAKKTIELNSRPQTDRSGALIGRTGAIRDITHEIEEREALNTLRADIGATLHVFRQTLQQLKHAIGAAADVLAGEAKVRLEPSTPEQLAASVRGHLKVLSRATNTFVSTARAVTHKSALADADLFRLAQLVEIMTSCETDPKHKYHWRDVWRSGAVEIQAICRRVSSGSVPRSAYAPVLASAEDIARLMGLATLSIAREAIAAVDAPVVALREFVTSGTRSPDATERCYIEECIHQAIANTSGFAEERKVRIRFEDATQTIVDVARGEVVRAIGNLLHNAIKYSFKRADGRTWIDVVVTTTPHKTAAVSVENWGVPIPREEVENGLVFRLGFRGRLSSDRGRLGTGVGLADSLAVARTHGGTLRIASRPAISSASSRNYDQPFVTTTVLELPIA